MKLVVADYPLDGSVAVEHTYDVQKLDLEFPDLHYIQPLGLKGLVEKGQGVLTFHGNLKTLIERTCGRCLKTVQEKVNQPFRLYYEVQEHEIIDTTDDLRELLILDHPLAYHCPNNCELPKTGALEDSAGQTENQSNMTHKGFLSLKKMWEKKKEERRNGTS